MSCLSVWNGEDGDSFFRIGNYLEEYQIYIVYDMNLDDKNV